MQIDRNGSLIGNDHCTICMSVEHCIVYVLYQLIADAFKPSRARRLKVVGEMPDCMLS